MESLLLYFIKLNLFISVLVLTQQFLFRKYANFNFSRPYLLMGSIGSLLIPFFNLSSWNQYGDQIGISQLLEEVAVQSSYSIDHTFDWVSLLFISYAVVCGFFFLRFLFSIVKLLQLRSKAIPSGDHFILPNSTIAFSFGKWIFIGDQLSLQERDIILSHEKVHVSKRHSIDLILCQLLEVFLWINPLVFQLKPLFDEIHEYEADELSCQEKESYLNILLQQHFNHFSSLPIHQFNSTHLKHRIMRIKNQPNTRIKLKSIAFTAFAFISLFFVSQNLVSCQPIEEELVEVENSTKDLDKLAEFPGGKKAMFNYVIENTKYPKHLIDKDIQGLVYVEFKVEKDGSISNVQIIKEGPKELEEMALNAVKGMPNWTPAEKDGKKVASKMTLPIKFLPTPPDAQAPPPPPPPPPAAK